jgi:hypothetical protein
VSDIGYSNWRHVFGGKVDVFLNGDRIEKAVMADEEEGVIVRLKNDAEGNPIINEARDAVLRETLHGSVRIAAKD